MKCLVWSQFTNDIPICYKLFFYASLKWRFYRQFLAIHPISSFMGFTWRIKNSSLNMMHLVHRYPISAFRVLVWDIQIKSTLFRWSPLKWIQPQGSIWRNTVLTVNYSKGLKAPLFEIINKSFLHFIVLACFITYMTMTILSVAICHTITKLDTIHYNSLQFIIFKLPLQASTSTLFVLSWHSMAEKEF